jgi:hypothetical protein
MSGYVQGLVWRANIDAPNASYKAVLVRLADEADNEGYNVFPSNETVATDTQLSPATVKRAKKWLLEGGWLLSDFRPSRRRFRTRRYRINIEALESATKPKKSIDYDSVSTNKDHPCGEMAHLDPGPRATSGSQWRKGSSLKRKSGSPDDPLPYTRKDTLGQAEKMNGHRQASPQPEGCLLGVYNGGGGEVGVLEALLKRLDIDREGADASDWQELIGRVSNGWDANTTYAWLSKKSGIKLAEERIIVVPNSFKKQKLHEIFGGILKELGWRVEVAK